MRMFTLCGILCGAVLGSFEVQADELIYSFDPRVLGFQAVEVQNSSRVQSLHTTDDGSLNTPLPWPIQFEDAEHSLGNPMAQFQSYMMSDPYYHGGSDLRARSHSEVRAPIAGKLEAGYYSYQTLSDGSLKKFIKPWPASGDPLYFELAIVANNGLRFEMHHVDPRTLPVEIVHLLDQGAAAPALSAGTLLGYVAEWPVRAADGTYYHHVHYNIVDPSGARWNPERLSVHVDDTIAPDVHGVFAIAPNGRVSRFNGGLIMARPQEFVIAVTDRVNANVYLHVPQWVEIAFTNGAKSSWDFREKLLGPDGRFPKIWDFYRAELRTPEGETLRTQGDYEGQYFLIRLPVPSAATGPFEIRVGDGSGNTTRIAGSL